jgi:RNA polymerase sigma factor (TIGR02999 family)
MPEDKITHILDALNQGNVAAWNKLIRATYPQMATIAHEQRLKQGTSSDTLNTKALIHEAFMSLYYSQQIQWVNRTHFYLTAAQAMRFMLLNHDRDKRRIKRGHWAEHIEFDEETMSIQDESSPIESLDEALKSLEKKHPRAHKIVMLRFFLGMQESEIAEMLGLSTRTIIRDWLVARALLAQSLGAET